MDIADDDIDIDNRVKDLLSRGLDRYGEGDLEGALAHWKHALILDPENEKAAQYASYVEDNHDLAEGGAKENGKRAEELDYPFGLEELGLAKLRNDELDDDYESLVVEESKQKATSATAANAETAATDSDLDDGWDVDEGWVSDLVEQSETAFAAPAEESKEESAKKAAAEKSEEKEPAKEAASSSTDSLPDSLDLDEGSADSDSSDAGFDDLELGSFGGDVKAPVKSATSEKPTKEVRRADLEQAIETPTKEVRREDLEEALLTAESEANDQGDDEEEEDDDAYAEMEIGVASDGLDLGFAEDEADKKTAADEEEDSEASFGDLSLDDETDFGDIGSDDKAEKEEKADKADKAEQAAKPAKKSVPDIPMQLGSSGRSKRDSGGASSRVSEVINAIEVGVPDIEIGSAGASDSEPKSGNSVFDANESGDIDLPDEGAEDGSDDEVLAKIESQAPSGDTNERSTFIVGKLVERALHQHGCGKHESASFSAGAALEEADDCAAAQKLIYAHEDDLVSVLMAGLGEPNKIPELVVPLTEIPIDEIDNRAAFLLTRVDGSLSLEEILVVCGMPKLEALRHLSRMHSRSYLSLQ